MQDFKDAVMQWLIAAAAFLIAGGVWSLAPMSPVPLSVMLYLTGSMVAVVAVIYFAAGCISGHLAYQAIRAAQRGASH